MSSNLINIVSRLLLPYQKKWILDDSEKKLWVKSRQIGGTWTEALCVTLICLAVPRHDKWWISRDDKQAKEFVLYIRNWVNVINAIARRLRIAGVCIREYNEDGDYIDADRQVRVRVVEFHNGSRVLTLTSNPDAARGNHGSLGIDELAAHQDQERLLRVAKPIITTGGNLTIISTHDGPGVFNDLVNEVEMMGNPKNFSMHKITIVDAVEQGYVRDVVNPIRAKLKKGPMADDAWLNQMHADCLDEIEWQQEYMCICVSEAYRFLKLDLINKQSRPWPWLRGQNYEGCVSYMGMDVGRHRDLTVFWVCTRVGEVLYTREVKTLDQQDYDTQEQHLHEIMNQYKIVRACIDATTKGEQLAERAIKKYGENRVESVIVHQKAKLHLAPLVLSGLQRGLILLPEADEVRDDLYRIEKQVGDSGAIRYFAPSTKDGHSDRFFALALCLEAAGEPEVVSAARLKPGATSHRQKFTTKKSKYGGY